MAERGGGHLLFVSSLSGKAASPTRRCTTPPSSACVASRLALRAELRASGVGVSVVCPGFIRDAGMFAEAEVKLPRGVGTRSPQDVARATAGAIERNRGEVDVAPFSLRAGAIFAGVAPEIAATVTRKTGSDEHRHGARGRSQRREALSDLSAQHSYGLSGSRARRSLSSRLTRPQNSRSCSCRARGRIRCWRVRDSAAEGRAPQAPEIPAPNRCVASLAHERASRSRSSRGA